MAAAAVCIGLYAVLDISGPALAGLFCGALTNTPALAASLEAINSFSGRISADMLSLYKSAPVVAYGLTPYFMAYPGTITLSESTYLALLTDILNSLIQHGFKRIVIVNGHGGNSPAQPTIDQFAHEHMIQIKWHNWWNAPRTWAKVQAIDPVASHASWMENFPWNRLLNVALPNQQKQMIDPAHVKQLRPIEAREYLGDGNYGGLYQRSDDEMNQLWQIGVKETRTVIEEGW